jgi:FkbM family methyltransferase
MHYDFIEIGTSDFDTILQSPNPGIGLSIEPLKLYLDKLPNVDGVTKINCAISYIDGFVDVYWIDPDDISKHNLPDWLRGCNSIIKPHPTAHGELAVRNLLDIYNKTQCETITWKTLVERYNVESVKYLKIDTEGHDCAILNNILDSNLEIYPDEILFENNVLTNHEESNKTIDRLLNIGYTIINRNPDNIHIKFNKN